MTVRLLSPRPAAQSAPPQTARKPVPDHLRSVLPFSVRKPVAAAVVAALLLGATLPVAQHAGAQAPSEQEVMEARGWIERAATPGDEQTAIEVDATDLPADAPAVHVDAITIPYDPNAQEQIEPFDPHGERQIEPADGPAAGPAPE